MLRRSGFTTCFTPLSGSEISGPRRFVSMCTHTPERLRNAMVVGAGAQHAVVLGTSCVVSSGEQQPDDASASTGSSLPKYLMLASEWYPSHAIPCGSVTQCLSDLA